MKDFGHVLEGELPDRMVQMAYGFAAVQDVALVHWFEVVGHAAFAEKLGLTVVGVPAGVFDPPAHEKIAPGHPVDVKSIRVGRDLAYLFFSLRCAAFVGVQAKNPFVGAGSDGLVAQITKALEVDLDHLRTQLRCDFGGTVGAPGVDQYYFIGPLRAFYGGGDFLGFVKSNDVDGNEAHQGGVSIRPFLSAADGSWLWRSLVQNAGLPICLRGDHDLQPQRHAADGIRRIGAADGSEF